MTRSRYLIMIAVIVFGGIVADQIAKEIAIATLTVEGRSVPTPERHALQPIAFPQSWYPHDLFRFQYATNTGAFLSLGSALPDNVRFWLLTCLNMAILSGLGIVLVIRKGIKTPVAIALACILSGGVGNIIDRIFRGGEVVDYMNMGFKAGGIALRTGIFNIADLGIVAGLVLLVALEVFRKKPAQPDADSSEKAKA
jgi:signal peptidase II